MKKKQTNRTTTTTNYEMHMKHTENKGGGWKRKNDRDMRFCRNWGMGKMECEREKSQWREKRETK